MNPSRYELKPIRNKRAIVYDLEDESLSRVVTVLGLPPAPPGWEETRIRPWARLLHPNIPTVYEIARQRGCIYLISEQWRGECLQDYLDEERDLGPRGVRHLAHMLVAALGHAHQKGTIHGLISPEQMMLRADGTMKLHFLPADPLESWSGKGQPYPTGESAAYQAPEQVRGEPAGPPADIWALGILLYRLMGGTLPFSSDDDILDSDPEPLIPFVGYPLNAPQVVERCLRKDPRERFPDVDALIRELYPGGPVGAAELKRARDLHRRALEHTAAGQWMEAVACWIEVERICPGEAGLRNNMGAALARLGMFAEAAEVFANAAALAPDQPLFPAHQNWALSRHLGAEDDGRLPCFFDQPDQAFLQPGGPDWPLETSQSGA